MIKSLRTKLALSFGAIFLVLAIATALNLFYVNQVSEVQDRVINLRFKTVNAGKDISNGINASLAALRGYMILGADPAIGEKLIKQREQAWQLIDKSLATFDEVSGNWTVPKNVEIYTKLKGVLGEFKAAQQKVEDIAQAQDNIPSYSMLLTDAAPRASKILASITGIINIEQTLPASSERKAMLVQLANSRGSFAVGLASIRAYLLSGNEKFKKAFEAKWEVNKTAFNAIDTKYGKLFNSEQQAHWKTYQQYIQEFAPLPAKMFALRSAVDWNQANYILGTQAAPKASLAVGYLKQMQESQNGLLNNDIQSLDENSTLLNQILLISALISIVVSVLVAIGFARNLLSRLSPVLQKAVEISNNDLTTPAIEIKGKDEIAVLSKAVNKMSQALSETLSSTAKSMQSVSTEAQNIYAANTDMSKTIDQQNQQISLIAAAIEELSASSQEVSNNSEQTAISATNSLHDAQEGGSLVRNSLSQMNEISEAFDESAQSIGSLSEQSRKVEDILGVIRGIAEQTNLLALNAAIEAARAGEQGRGFAVVADEVRQLASRTTEATADVEQAIEQMRNDAQVAETSMEVGRDKVHKGIEISDKVSEMLEKIIGSATEVSDKIKEIASNSNEQSLVTAEIAQNTNKASTLSAQVNEGINNVVEMTKLVSEDTTKRADELLRMVR